MLIKGVFFDLYGTLLISKNSAKAWKNWFNTFFKLMKNLGLRLTKNDFANACEGFFERANVDRNNKELSVYERKIKKFATELNLNLNDYEVKEIQRSTIKTWHKYVKIDPETIPLLTLLKSKKSMALITNFDHPPHIYEVLSKYKLSEYFDFISISGEIGYDKPDPRIFYETLNNIGLTVDEVVFIGDSKEDVEGAINAGIKPILIRRKKYKNGLIEKDYYSKSIAKNLNSRNLPPKPWKTISNLSELYNLFNL